MYFPLGCRRTMEGYLTDIICWRHFKYVEYVVRVPVKTNSANVDGHHYERAQTQQTLLDKKCCAAPLLWNINSYCIHVCDTRWKCIHHVDLNNPILCFFWTTNIHSTCHKKLHGVWEYWNCSWLKLHMLPCGSWHTGCVTNGIVSGISRLARPGKTESMC